jgi:limonene-1,2-epoxide hydrolase
VPASNAEIVRSFMASWRKGNDEMIESFRATLAPDVVWENSGMPAIRSCDEAIGLLADQEHGLGVAAVDVEMVHIAEIGNVVLTERVDTLRRADGTAITAVSLVGILELNEAGQITAWREYFDPSTLSQLRSPRPDRP